MAYLRVQIALADGRWIEQEGALDLLSRLVELESFGAQGQQIIKSLWPEDWGSEPSFVRLTGTDGRGVRFDLTIFGD